MSLFRNLVGIPLDFALPRRCGSCGTVVGKSGHFCAPCWQSLRFLPDFGCLQCNTPVAIPGGVCAPCMEAPPRHDGVLAAVDYCDVAKSLVFKLKYARKPATSRVMAAFMYRHAQRHPQSLLVPVPLHRSRLWTRGFNQSLSIARSLSRLTGQEVLPKALERHRRTVALEGLGRRERAREVSGAIRVPEPAKAHIGGRDILLVDDVYTTGATANACAHALKRGGASAVRVISWARVLMDDA